MGVRIPPGVQEDVGRQFWINAKKSDENRFALPTLNGEYSLVAKFSVANGKMPVRFRLLAPYYGSKPARYFAPLKLFESFRTGGFLHSFIGLEGYWLEGYWFEGYWLEGCAVA